MTKFTYYMSIFCLHSSMFFFCKFPHLYIVQYMDNILTMCYNKRKLQREYEDVMICLLAAGLQVETGKFRFYLHVNICIMFLSSLQYILKKFPSSRKFHSPFSISKHPMIFRNYWEPLIGDSIN